MKKILVVSLSLVVLMGCEEKQLYEQAVMEQMKVEKDLKDYKIEPEKMTKCVVDTSSANMPGFMVFAPERLQAYKNYAKMLTLNSSQDPKKTLDELRVDFGSPKNLADAHSNYTESVVTCMSSLVTNTEEAVAEAEKKQ